MDGLPEPFVKTSPRGIPFPDYSPESNQYSPRSGGYSGSAIVTPGEITLPDGTVIKGWVHLRGSKVTIKPNAGQGFEPKEYELGDLSVGDDAARLRDTVRTMSMKANRILQAESTSGGRDFRNPDDEKTKKEPVGHARPHTPRNLAVTMGTRHLKELEPVDKGHAFTFNVKGGDETAPGQPAGTGAAFSGYVVIAGSRVAVSGSPNTYVRVHFDGSTPVYTSDGTCTDTYEAYLVSQTFGDIHETRG